MPRLIWAGSSRRAVSGRVGLYPAGFGPVLELPRAHSFSCAAGRDPTVHCASVVLRDPPRALRYFLRHGLQVWFLWPSLQVLLARICSSSGPFLVPLCIIKFVRHGSGCDRLGPSQEIQTKT